MMLPVLVTALNSRRLCGRALPSPRLVAVLFGWSLLTFAVTGYCAPPPFDAPDIGTAKPPADATVKPAPSAAPSPGPSVAPAPTQTAPTGAATPAGPASVGPTPAQNPVATTKPQAPPRAILVWSGPLLEGVPAPLRQALGERLQIPTGGALRAAAQTVIESRPALAEMRCSDALPNLAKASDGVLNEVLLPDARPLLTELFGLMLLCADRVSDSARAEQASAALVAMQATLPADVALVLARYQSPPRFGPPRAPVHVDSDPPGAVVLRDLVPIGVTPIDVPGGLPENDFIDIELPGFRKVHRSLGSNQEIFLSLRPEDRIPVLLDRAALFPPGSEGQEAVLRAVAASSGAQVLPSHLILTLGPKQTGGMPVSGEPLIARFYDLTSKAWIGTPSEIAAGPIPTQTQALVALADSAAAAPRLGPGSPLPPGVVATPGKPAPPPKSKSKLPFANVKWYTWVVAGGVAALIAGLLIAERVSPQTVTVSATH